MLGRLFKEAIPIYLRLLLNILIIMSGFVFFNMLMYRTTRKFETVELSYFEFFFNYFQYGIYENFFALNRFGSAAHALYLLNLLVLLYVGNNILQSILANEVLKFSYLDSLNEMLETIDGDCPACGQSPKAKPQISLQLSQ